ncbi:MAG: restriction endonuclease subunit S [Prevotella sp.]|nr:restriction endonuclease subunit S [Prevotella sp.]
MTEKTNIQQGYKDSPLGIIPKEWEVKRLGAFAPLQRGFDLPTDKIVRGEYPVVYSNGVLNYHYEYKAKGPGVVTGRSGTIGKVTFVESNYWPHNTSLWVTDFKGNNPKYVFHLYSFLDLSKFASGSGVPTLNRNDVHASKFAIPPTHEQNKIVEVLDFWDTAIEKQSELIEKLKLRKRALMQQLLTGKKRLKVFGGEWKEVRLGDAGTAYGGLVNKNKEDFENGNALFITYMNVFSNGKIDIDNLGQVRILSSEKQEQVQYGDVFFTVSSETPDEVGMTSVLLNEVQNTYLNSFCFGYRLNDFKSIVPVYASYLFRGDDFRKEMYKIAQGSTRFNISKTEVLNMRITIPSIEEQNAIASVLVNADKEIEIQKQKLAAMQAQKKGLMQVLLTGKRRIL